jgi:hypothetical protein
MDSQAFLQPLQINVLFICVFVIVAYSQKGHNLIYMKKGDHLKPFVLEIVSH